MNTARETSAIAASVSATPRAKSPISCQILNRLKDIASPQLERNLEHLEHGDRLSAELGRCVVPALDHLDGGRDKRLVALEHLDLADLPLLGDHHLEDH